MLRPHDNSMKLSTRYRQAGVRDIRPTAIAAMLHRTQRRWKSVPLVWSFGISECDMMRLMPRD
jgi:hypothetical protein